MKVKFEQKEQYLKFSSEQELIDLIKEHGQSKAFIAFCRGFCPLFLTVNKGNKLVCYMRFDDLGNSICNMSFGALSEDWAIHAFDVDEYSEQ